MKTCRALSDWLMFFCKPLPFTWWSEWSPLERCVLSIQQLWCCCPHASVNMSKKGQGWERKNTYFYGALFNDKSGFWFSWVCLVPDLALYSVPVVLPRFRDILSLQLLEHSSAWWKRAVDITQKSLRVGMTVLDKAVIQLLQLIRKPILVAQRRHVSFRYTIESCCRWRLIVCVYCNGWGMLTGCSC